MTLKNLYRLLHAKHSWLSHLRRKLLQIPFVENMVFKANMSDDEYIKMKYKECFGMEPDLINPRNFNEKNNWRKLHDRKEIYTCMVDKYMIKAVIAERVGKKYTFPLIGVWQKPEQIEWDKLPEQFVLKSNHAGGVLVCRDKTTFDKRNAIRILKRNQKINYYIRSREWPYKNVDRKIIAEQYMGENLVDFKNYCFNGKLYYTFIWQNHSREDGLKPKACFCGAYDRDWKKTGLEIDYPTDDLVFEKPECYQEMVKVAEEMSQGIPFVRVDCYIIMNHVYVGEMTFFPWGGFQKFKDEKWNNFLGDLEKLPGIDY